MVKLSQKACLAREPETVAGGNTAADRAGIGSTGGCSLCIDVVMMPFPAHEVTDERLF
jgi:hypothetical protein